MAWSIPKTSRMNLKRVKEIRQTDKLKEDIMYVVCKIYRLHQLVDNPRFKFLSNQSFLSLIMLRGKHLGKIEFLRLYKDFKGHE